VQISLFDIEIEGDLEIFLNNIRCDQHFKILKQYVFIFSLLNPDSQFGLTVYFH